MKIEGWPSADTITLRHIFATNSNRSVLGRSDRYNYVFMCLCSSVQWHRAQQPATISSPALCESFFCQQLFHCRMLLKPQTRAFITFGELQQLFIGYFDINWFFFSFLCVLSLWHNNSTTTGESKKKTRKSNRKFVFSKPKMGFRTKRPLSSSIRELCSNGLR